MKILSIKQPWAWLIVNAPEALRKDVENRTWWSGYNGPVLVHASVKADRDAMADESIARILDARGVALRGGVVGITEIVDCVTTHSSKWFNGPYGFVLRNSRALPFVPWKGQLGLRDAPPELLRKLNL